MLCRKNVSGKYRLLEQFLPKQHVPVRSDFRADNCRACDQAYYAAFSGTFVDAEAIIVSIFCDAVRPSDPHDRTIREGSFSGHGEIGKQYLQRDFLNNLARVAKR